MPNKEMTQPGFSFGGGTEWSDHEGPPLDSYDQKKRKPGDDIELDKKLTRPELDEISQRVRQGENVNDVIAEVKNRRRGPKPESTH